MISLGNLSNPKLIHVYRKLLIAKLFISKNGKEQVRVSTHGQGLYTEGSGTIIYGSILSGQIKLSTVTQQTFISAGNQTLMV